MNNINKAIDTITYITKLNNRDHWMNKLHPVFKLLVTFIYIVFVISINKYDLLRIIPFIFYPFFILSILNISIIDSLKKTFPIILLSIFIGILNPIFDKNILTIGSYTINGGYISFLTLTVKGLCTVLASYILIISTSLNDICYGLRCLRFPSIFIMIVSLIIRYINVLLVEYDDLSNAYYLRSYKKGIDIKDWGSFIGLLLLRSIDKAKAIQESMDLRGYDINKTYIKSSYETNIKSYTYILLSLLYFIVSRHYYLILIIGGLFK